MLSIAYTPSPNYDDRPSSCEVDCIVIHAISLPPGCYGGNAVTRFFQNTLLVDEHAFYREIENLKVSAHFFINRQGQISQFVPTDKRAWHAGQSNLEGRCAVNDFSIGIELEGCDDDCFTDGQYHALSQLCLCIMMAYPKILPARVVGHCDIAPERKTDPGPHFDWQRLYAQIQPPAEK